MCLDAGKAGDIAGNTRARSVRSELDYGRHGLSIRRRATPRRARVVVQIATQAFHLDPKRAQSAEDAGRTGDRQADSGPATNCVDRGAD